MQTADIVWVLGLFTHPQLTTDIKQQSNIHNLRNDSTLIHTTVKTTQPALHIPVQLNELPTTFQCPCSENYLEEKKTIVIQAFWYITSCTLWKSYRRFGGTCCLHIQVLAVQDVCAFPDKHLVKWPVGRIIITGHKQQILVHVKNLLSLSTPETTCNSLVTAVCMSFIELLCFGRAN
jgi:hypothetical protein